MYLYLNATHCILHTEHYTLHTWKLHSVHHTVHTAHSLLKTWDSTLQVVQSPLPTSHCRLYTAHFTTPSPTIGSELRMSLFDAPYSEEQNSSVEFSSVCFSGRNFSSTMSAPGKLSWGRTTKHCLFSLVLLQCSAVWYNEVQANAMQINAVHGSVT